jgi:hypothetical protein
MVMWSPLGTPATYFETGSLNLSLPSCASCTITAAVIVLVLEAIRKSVSVVGGIFVPSCVVPYVAVNSPWGVRRSTTAPGIRSSRAVASSIDCSADWLIGLSADEPLVVPPPPVTICARSRSLREGSFCWAKVETIRPKANPRASSRWSFMIFAGSSRLSSPILLLLRLIRHWTLNKPSFTCAASR